MLTFREQMDFYNVYWNMLFCCCLLLIYSLIIESYFVSCWKLDLVVSWRLFFLLQYFRFMNTFLKSCSEMFQKVISWCNVNDIFSGCMFKLVSLCWYKYLTHPLQVFNSDPFMLAIGFLSCWDMRCTYG